MMQDFMVKVYRYERDSFWDGWYFSKVYAIDNEKDSFLVYDDGSFSAWSTEEDFCPAGFNWVCFTELMDDPPTGRGKITRHPVVELYEEEK